MRFSPLAFLASLPFLSSCFSYEWKSTGQQTWSWGGGGATGLWILANISYAGMRAQSNPNSGWRIITFLLGLPGTLVTYFAVIEGSERAYGVSLPTAQKGQHLGPQWPAASADRTAGLSDHPDSNRHG